MKENHIEFIKKAREEYRKISSVCCPALGRVLVYFNRHGFNHLLRKDRRLRSEFQQRRRLELVPYAPEVLVKAQTIHKYEQITHGNAVTQFWNIRGFINFSGHRKMIHIVIRKLDSGRMHFFSIYDKHI